MAMPPPTEREPRNPARVKASDPDDGWLIDLTRTCNKPLEDLVAGAVRAAGAQALHPVGVRAGRYTVIGTRTTSTDQVFAADRCSP